MLGVAEGLGLGPRDAVGVGVGVPVGSMVIIDLQYRYGRVAASDGGLNINRAGIGVGVRF
jgi:opacity protein-like surface antigen